MEVLKFNFNDTDVDFEFGNSSTVMVNATQMAKIFNETIEHFTRLDKTQAFIQACLKNPKTGFISVETKEDLIISKQKSGTWMHRILALKFAAWLDPEFELWVYSTIDYILFNHYRMLEESLKCSAERKAKIETLEKELSEDTRFLELEQLKLSERQAAYQRSQYNKQQLELFQGGINN